MPWSAAIRAISASSAADSSMAPLPCDTRLTVMPSAAAWSMTARSTSGPSTLGISIRKWAPSGNLSVAGGGAGSARTPSRASTSAPLSLIASPHLEDGGAGREAVVTGLGGPVRPGGDTF